MGRKSKVQVGGEYRYRKILGNEDIFKEKKGRDNERDSKD